MSPYMNGSKDLPYSPLEQTKLQFTELLSGSTLTTGLASAEFQECARGVTFSSKSDEILFPCPFQQAEAVSILKAIEACWAVCIADLRYGKEKRKIDITMERSARYLLGSYLFSIDGLAKGEAGVMEKLKDTDLKQAQSILYRRFSTNLYATKIPGQYFHLHGSLEASTALNMVGMDAFRPDLTEYRQCIDAIELATKNFTVDELEEINAKHKQAGVTANKRETFMKTSYGKEIDSKPRWSVSSLENTTPPVAFPPSQDPKSILAGIKVIEMCRIIAGPSICRILTEYGADVIKVTSPNLSDTPFFQIEGNMGKHATDLDLRSDEGRKVFEELLQEADVVVDGYRTGALSRLGYGPKEIEDLAKKRGRGMVYVSENCFGYGQHIDRPGWQQIADSVSGVAWAQGRFMGLNEPCIPPFPMSDYGTGLMGAIAALEALYRRAKSGGSYHAKCCLVQYDNFLFQLGQYPEHIQDEMRKRFEGPFFDLRHSDHTDNFSKAALKTMRKVVPWVFEDESRWGQKWMSKGYNSVEVRCIRPVSNVEGVEMAYKRATRPNGTDAPTWKGWEVEDPIADT